MQKYKHVALCKLNGKPIYGEQSYLNAISRTSKPIEAAKFLWQQAANKLQKQLGNGFVVTLKKCGVKHNGFGYYKLVTKKVERLRKVVLFVPYIKGKTRGSNNKLKEARYLDKFILDGKKEYVRLEVSQ